MMTLPPTPKQLAAFTETQARHCALNYMVEAYGQQCAMAERERILKIAYEQSTAYGKTGECMWIGIKAHVRNGK